MRNPLKNKNFSYFCRQVIYLAFRPAVVYNRAVLVIPHLQKKGFRLAELGCSDASGPLVAEVRGGRERCRSRRQLA